MVVAHRCTPALFRPRHFRVRRPGHELRRGSGGDVLKTSPVLSRCSGRGFLPTLTRLLTLGFSRSTWKRPSASVVKVSPSGQRPSGQGRLPPQVQVVSVSYARQGQAVFVDQSALDRAGDDPDAPPAECRLLASSSLMTTEPTSRRSLCAKTSSRGWPGSRPWASKVSAASVVDVSRHWQSGHNIAPRSPAYRRTDHLPFAPRPRVSSRSTANESRSRDIDDPIGVIGTSWIVQSRVSHAADRPFPYRPCSAGRGVGRARREVRADHASPGGTVIRNTGSVRLSWPEPPGPSLGHPSFRLVGS